MEQVYIFDFGDKIKAGYSTNVKKRLRTIELSSGLKARQVYCVQAGRKEEKLLHTWLKNRLEGEFFAFPFVDAKEILEKIAQGEITNPPNKTVPALKAGHIRYKIDILSELKKAGYNTTILRREKILSESTIQALRTGKVVSIDNISRICAMLHCQPGDIIEYVKEDNTDA